MRSSLYALFYLCRHNDRDHPEDKRQEVKKGAHDGDNDDQDQEVLWPVIVRVLRCDDVRDRDLYTLISAIHRLYSKEMTIICLLVGRMDKWAEMMVGPWPHRRQEEAHEAGY